MAPINPKDLETDIKYAKAIRRKYKHDFKPHEGITLTVGYDPATGHWSSQTGDNSFTGPAYGYPIWAVVEVAPRSRMKDLVDDIIEQLQEAIGWE